MAFELFEKSARGGRGPTGPWVRLGRKGTLVISEAALALIGSPPRVTLLFDRDQHLIGIAAAAASEPHGWSAKVATSARSVTLTVERFLTRYAITADGATFVPGQLGNMLIVGPVEDACTPTADKVREVLALAGQRR